MASTNLDVVVQLVNKISKPLDDAMGSLRQTGNQFFSSMTKVGAGMTAIGAAGVYGIANAVKTFADFEKEMSNVGAVTESTEAQMKSMTDMAMKLGAETKFTAKEAAEAMSELGMAGFTAEEIMQSISGTMSLAAATNIELAQAAEISSNVLRGFNLSASEAGRVVDVLAKAANSSSIDMSDMFESMKYFAPTAAAFRISLEEASAVIGILGNNGIKGSLATRALGTALTRLTKPTDAMVAVMKDLNLKFFDAEGRFIGMQNLVAMLQDRFKGMTDEQKQFNLSTLFGAEAIQEMNVLLSAGSDNLGKYTESMRNAGGVADEMAKKQMDNLAGSIERLSGALDASKLGIGKQLEDQVRTIVDAFTRLVDKINSLPPSTQETIAKILVLGTAFTLLVGGVGLFVGFIPTLVAGMGAIATAAGIAWTAITGPIGLMILTIAALSTDIYLLIKHWDAVKAKAIEVFGGIHDYVIASLVSVGEWIMGKWNEITAYLYEKWEYIKSVFSNAWEWITAKVESSIKFLINIIVGLFALMGIDIIYHMEGILATVTHYWDVIKSSIQQVVEAIRSFVSEKMNQLADWMRMVWTKISTGARTEWNNIKMAASQALDDMLSKLKEWTEPFQAAWKVLWDGIKAAGVAVMESLKDTVAGMFNWIIAKLNKAISAINTVASAGSAMTGFDFKPIQEIPMLANGGIVRKPTLAMVGEAGPEAVIPLSKGRSYGVGSGQTINIVVNGDVTGQDLIDRIGRELTRRVQLSTATV